ncbi:MAG: UbiX family flavin prenyltransferase [Anaeromicrobium sp.]|jgi:4-hydroxy-3-polyprenylbenzoate decarboxylase|uniref:UbiX family flavin prenyltransferase n=1 Tax=Anaeromicrobium sp. TaxID=1929132 RepID=UPI0025DE9847|nr:UbiX family flavin prenyltransferase [Anaeromicrobium sp.]MCT4593555.1 UbiX family flavin prenyltransferase [Anaeromicrobium sp.]
MGIIVGMTGGSCSLYGVALLKALEQLNIETHLIVSRMGEYVTKHECHIDMDELKSMATYFHEIHDLAAPVASGSFKSDGMIIIPCSMNTLGAIANGLSLNLIHRAADVTIKESRKLVIVPRETPLSVIHLENMLKLAKIGVKIVPAAPGFYHKPQTIGDLVNIMVGRVLDQLGVEANLFERWK